jgi:hypothetical protein
MTSERKKSIIVLITTFLLGIALGFLTPGIVRKLGEREQRTTLGPAGRPSHKREWFIVMLHRVVQPDSAQLVHIQPVTEWASIQIDSIENSANRQMSFVLDSVKSTLTPVLTPEQQKRLEEFDARAQGHWKQRGRRHRQ